MSTTTSSTLLEKLNTEMVSQEKYYTLGSLECLCLRRLVQNTVATVFGYEDLWVRVCSIFLDLTASFAREWFSFSSYFE